MVTKEEFSDWRNHPITKELFDSLLVQANMASTELLRRFTIDIEKDQWLKGQLVGIDLACGFTPELVPETVEETIDGVSYEDVSDAT